MAKPYSRREELIQVAIDLFAAHGYAGTSIRDIANATGHSVSNIYHYFKNKEELWLAILEYSSGGIPDVLTSAAQLPGKPIERFARMLHAHLNEAVRHHREAKIFFIDEERLSGRGKEMNRRVQRAIFNLYKEQLAILQQQGVIQSGNLSILAFNVLGNINWHLRWQSKIKNISAADVRSQIVEYILQGMGIDRKTVSRLTDMTRATQSA